VTAIWFKLHYYVLVSHIGPMQCWLWCVFQCRWRYHRRM